jgi:hypothetical protein
MNRRFFLITFFSVISYWFLGNKNTDTVLSRLLEPDSKEMPLNINPIDGVFNDVKSAQELGKRYLDTHPQERKEKHLWKSLANKVGIKNIYSDPKAFKKVLAQQNQEDFRNEDVVIVDGWLMGRTEVEVCGLAYLTL